MDIEKAFEALHNTAENELEQVQDQGASYFTSGDMDHVRATADRVEEIQELIEAIDQLKDQYARVLPDLLSPRHCLFDTRTQPSFLQNKTSQEEYRLPILQALVEMGGKGRTALILDRVGELMVNKLSDYDRDLLPSKRDYRWRNAAMWERLTMVKEGLLSDQSPNGTWEITTKGRNSISI